MNDKKLTSHGSSIIELIVVFALLALLLPVLVIGLTSSREGKAQQKQRTTAVAKFKETQEAVKQIKDLGWTAFAVNGIFHPVINNNRWSLVNGSITENGFITEVIISDAYRDNNGNIVSTGGTNDPSTKKVTISISWISPINQSVSATNYYTRYRDNLSLLQTTLTDFKTGTPSGTSIVASEGSELPDDGEVILGAGGNSNWCAPDPSMTTFNLNGQGITTSISATTSATYDFLYTTTGGNASGNSMDGIKVNHDNPPSASNVGIYNLYKTYGVYVDNPNQFVYLTSDHPSTTVDIVQVAVLPYTQTGKFKASGGGAGTTVYSAFNPSHNHDIGYVTAGTYLYTFDLANKNGTKTELGKISIAGTGTKIIVVGNYAYIAQNSNTEQLAIFDISNPSSPVKVSKINVNNSLPARDVFINSNGTRAYLVTSQTNPNKNNFFIINTSNKIATLPTPLGTYNTGTMNPRGIAAVPGNRIIIVGSGGQQYQVLKIDNESQPVYCGGLTNPHGATTLNALASLLRPDGSAFSYVLSNGDNELLIIEGGPGGGSYSSNGSYESKSFDTVFQSAFNRFSSEVAQPNQATIKMQVAISNAVNNSCVNANYTYIGPDIQNPTTSYFTPVGNTISASLPLINIGNYVNPGRCMRYKVIMTTEDKNATPVFSDFILNYSP